MYPFGRILNDGSQSFVDLSSTTLSTRSTKLLSAGMYFADAHNELLRVMPFNSFSKLIFFSFTPINS